MAQRSSIEANGLRFSVLDFGGDGPYCLLLHGANSYAATWGAWVRSTRLPFHFMAFDQRGQGDSDRPDQGYDALTMGADAAAVWDALGHGSAVVIGASMGGNNAMSLAAQRPDLVRAAVLVDPAYRIPPDVIQMALDGAAQTVTTWPSRAEWLDSLRTVYGAGHDAELEEYFAPGVIIAPDGAITSKTDPVIQRKITEGFRDNLHGLASRVSVPTLILQASARRVLPDAAASELHTAIVDSQLAVIEGQHMLQRDNPEAFEAAVRDFLVEQAIIRA